MTRSARMPTVFLPHGGGPFSYVDFGLDPRDVEPLAAYWRGLPDALPQRPRAVLMISAHWETRVPTVQTAARPPMLFDYYGFPDAAYTLDWPAPGDPQLAADVRGLLAKAGFNTAEDATRGYDHGTFVPMGRVFPKADVPCVQLSLMEGLDPSAHLDMGRALAPLRDQGVLIVGSGMSYHNMRGFRDPRAGEAADAFDAWLHEAMAAPAGARNAALTAWHSAPAARRVHPREEHLLPLMVAAGAAEDDQGHIAFSGPVMGKRVSAVHFGGPGASGPKRA